MWKNFAYCCSLCMLLSPIDYSERYSWEKKEKHTPYLSKRLPYWLGLYALSKNAGPDYEWIGAGLTNVNISGLKNGAINLSSNNWAYKVLSSILFKFSIFTWWIPYASFFPKYESFSHESFSPSDISWNRDENYAFIFFICCRLDWKGNIIVCSSLLRVVTSGGYHNLSHQKTNLWHGTR